MKPWKYSYMFFVLYFNDFYDNFVIIHRNNLNKVRKSRISTKV